MTDTTKRQPAGQPTGGQFAGNDRTEAAVNLGAETPRVIARVQPQYWANDYAIDAGPAFDVDVTSIIAEMSPAERDQLSDNSYEADELYLRAVQEGLAQPHNGPFYVEVRDSLDEWETTPSDDVRLEELA